MVKMEEGKIAVRRDGVTGRIERADGSRPFRVCWEDGRHLHYLQNGNWCLMSSAFPDLDIVEVRDPEPLQDLAPWLEFITRPIRRTDKAILWVWVFGVIPGLLGVASGYGLVVLRRWMLS